MLKCPNDILSVSKTFTLLGVHCLLKVLASYGSVFEMQRSIWSSMYCASTPTSLALYPHASRDKLNYGDQYTGNSDSEFFITKCEHWIQKR